MNEPSPVFGDGTVSNDSFGLFSIRHDTMHEILRISGLAVQSIEDVDRYLAELGRFIRDMRIRCGSVRVLADLRGSPVRTQAAAEHLRQGNLTLYRAGDRVALLVDSSLFKMQLKRNLVEKYQNIFTSAAEAEAWLMAGDQSLSALANHAGSQHSI